MYPKLIVRNVIRNLQTYTIYFLSLTLIYSLLYAFNALPQHPVMQSLSGAKQMLTTIMTQYMGLLSYVVLVAVGFLVIYSTNFVLGRRKKELGLYATLGMKKRQIVVTLFCETLIVNFVALLVGLIVGLIVLVALAYVASDFFMGNYFGSMFFVDAPSIMLLLISYFVICAVIFLMDMMTFRKKRIISLIQETNARSSFLVHGNQTLQVALFIITTLIIVMGCLFFADYHHLSILKKSGILLITIFVITVILFYNSLSQFVLKLVALLPSIYFKKYNTFKIRQFSKQADYNAVTLAVLSMCLTLALTLLVFSGSSYSTMNKLIKDYSPYDLSINLYRGEAYHYPNETVKDRLKADGFDFSVVKEELEYTTYKSNLTYKDIIDTSQLWEHDKDLPKTKVPILSLSDYNRLLALQGKKAISLPDDGYIVNANYDGTIKQIKSFLASGKTLMINQTSLKLASQKAFKTVYFLSSVGTNDSGTIIVPDKVTKTLTVDSTTYVANYKKNTDKRKIETFLEQWIEGHYFTVNGKELNDFTYQTKVRLAELYLGFMGVIVFVLIFVGVVFMIISFSILSLQTSTSTLDSINDYKILYLLGNREKDNKMILLQQILSYFGIPFILAIPLSVALSRSLLGYFENFANTVIILDMRYLLLTAALLGIYLIFTYQICWRLTKISS